MDPAQQKAWWAEQHGHTPTDRAFREAGRDYSDQIADLRTGERVNLAGGEAGGTGTTRIAELKEIAHNADDIAAGKVPPPSQPIKLADPQGLAQQFHEKVTGNLRRGDPFEAIAQAQKGVDTLDSVRTAYGAQNIPTGELPGNLRQAMDLVKSLEPAHPSRRRGAAHAGRQTGAARLHRPRRLQPQTLQPVRGAEMDTIERAQSRPGGLP